MNILSSSIQQIPATRDRFIEIRTLIAEHLDVDIQRVTDEAHFIDDLGADWLDRLELMILIEDQFAGVEITDGDADQMEVVGDLIRYIENVIVRDGSTRGGGPLPPAPGPVAGTLDRMKPFRRSLVGL